MKVVILSSHISDGTVVAMNEDICYIYKHSLTEKGTQKLLKLLGETPEINTDHWEVEWERSASGS